MSSASEQIKADLEAESAVCEDCVRTRTQSGINNAVCWRHYWRFREWRENERRRLATELETTLREMDEEARLSWDDHETGEL